jgi:hypothetical protein
LRFAENLRPGTPKKFVGFALAKEPKHWRTSELAHLGQIQPILVHLFNWLSFIGEKGKGPGQKSTVIRSTLTFTAVNINKHALALNFDIFLWHMDYGTINNETDGVMRLTLRNTQKRTELKQTQKKNRNTFSPSIDKKKNTPWISLTCLMLRYRT